MAEKKNKGFSIAKLSKINSAEKTMLIAVCISSFIVGVTLVLSVYLVKCISFNSYVIDEQKVTLKEYENAVSSLNSINKEIETLSKNKNLEAVAIRTIDRDYCNGLESFNIKASDEHEIDRIVSCSSLRVIPETIPSVKNVDETMASVQQLFAFGNNGESMTSSYSLQEDETSSGITINSTSFHGIGLRYSVEDSSEKVRGILSAFENSIRNFDARTATIEWGEDGYGGASTITLSAKYTGYYSDKVGIKVYDYTICADAKNEKCAGADKTKSKERVIE